MLQKDDPMIALLRMEAARADDPAYLAHRLYWRKQHAKDAMKMMMQFFAAWMMLQSCIAYFFGNYLVRLVQVLIFPTISGLELFVGVAALAALFTVAALRSTYR